MGTEELAAMEKNKYSRIWRGGRRVLQETGQSRWNSLIKFYCV